MAGVQFVICLFGPNYKLSRSCTSASTSQHQELRNNERLLGVESSSLLGSGPETVKEGAEVAEDLLAFQRDTVKV